MNLILSGNLSEPSQGMLASATGATQVKVQPTRTVFYEVDDSKDTRRIVAELCDAIRTDHAFIQPEASLNKFKLIAFDMDSTLIDVECIDELAAYTNRRAEVAAITAAAMQNTSIDFETSLRARTAVLAGLHVDVLQRVYDDRISLTRGVVPLITAARRAGLRVGLLSGGFSFFAERLRHKLKLDFAKANDLEIKNNQLTGGVVGDIIDGEAKASILREQLSRLHIAPSETIVVGDGSNDLPMMREVQFSVAFHAKPIVMKAAAHAINFGPMDVLLDWLPSER